MTDLCNSGKAKEVRINYGSVYGYHCGRTVVISMAKAIDLFFGMNGRVIARRSYFSKSYSLIYD
ncbi:MAG: hypothetical protein ABIV21_08890 [Pyrinomonadaceae bacterium]